MSYNDYFECLRQEHIICPYCYEEINDDDYYVARHLYEKMPFDCPYCDGRFWVVSNVVYTTTRIDENGDEVDDWDDDEDDD